MCGWFNSAPEYDVYLRWWEEKQKTKQGSGWTPAEVITPSLLYFICLLGGPALFVLFAPEALVVVAFAFEQLLKVRLAVKFTLKGGEGAKAAETW